MLTGFDKAQQAYDSMEPPEYWDDPFEVIDDEEEGEGGE